MFDRAGRDAIGRVDGGSRGRARAGRRFGPEPLEARELMTASIEPVAAVSSPQYQGIQVPLVAGTTHAQTYTVTSSNPQVKATVASGQFLTVGVTHASSGANDPAFSGTMTFQLFQDLAPVAVGKISGLVNGTIPASQLAASQTENGVTRNPQSYAGTDYYVPSPANSATPPSTFHRVVSGFAIQGGSLFGDGTGQVFATPYAEEPSQQLAFTNTGLLALANSGTNTNDSQFFITTGTPTSLDYNYTIFGQLVSGQDVVNEINAVATKANSQGEQSTPLSPITFTQTSLSSTNPNGVVHVDTTGAPQGATSTITVTATDVTDGSTATQTFPVTVSAFPSSTPLPPFLGPFDSTINIGENQKLQLQLTGVATPPSDPLTYTVQGGVTAATSTTPASFSAVQHGTASVSSTGLVTFTPTTGYTGPVSLLVGVRDNTNRAGTTSIESPGNYKYQTITVNVASTTTPVAIRPIAQPQTTSVPTVGGTTIQLSGLNPNTTETTPLTYALVTQPQHGTVTNFNASTGTLTYTPTAGYLGADALQYTTTDPTSGLTSFPGTVTINVNQASTGAVRFFADDQSSATNVPGVLVVTPVPRTDGGTNTVVVSQSGGNINVTVNGVVDILQPSVANVDSIVVYGSKANDNITVMPDVTNPVTLSGGTFGRNNIQAGGGPATEQGWYGANNVLAQGSSNNFQFGRAGHVKFVKSTGTSDVIFAGAPGHFAGPSKVRILPSLPTGTFYTFSGRKLVKTSNPFAAQNTKTTTGPQPNPPAGNGTGTGGQEPGTVQTTAIHPKATQVKAKASKAAPHKK